MGVTEMKITLNDLLNAKGVSEPLQRAVKALIDRLEAAESDGLEQARLNGIGAEKELALMAKLEAADKECDALKNRLSVVYQELESRREALGRVCAERYDLLAQIISDNNEILTLRTKIEAIHSLLDNHESKIIRNAKDGYPEGREPEELTLFERVTALCKYASDWKRWCKEAEAKIEAMEKQEPVAEWLPLNSGEDTRRD